MKYMREIKRGLAVMGIIATILSLAGCERPAPKETVIEGQSQEITLASFEGTWFTRERSRKLVIKGDKLTYYFFYNGQFEKMDSCRVKLEYDYLENANGGSICGYRNIRLTADGILKADLEIYDAPTQTEEFAREGHEDDFPPLPVYPKKAEKIGDQLLTGFSISVSGPEPLRDYLGIDGLDSRTVACELYIDFSPDGTAVACGSERDGKWEYSEHFSYELSAEKVSALTELLVSDAVLRANPFEDSSDSMAPFNSLFLNAEFRSGELIKIESRYDYKIGNDKLAELLNLFYAS